MNKIPYKKYKSLTNKQKSAMVDKQLFLRNEPSGRDYTLIANSMAILSLLRAKIDHKVDNIEYWQRIWQDMMNHLLKDLPEGVSRLEHVVRCRPLRLGELIVDAYLIATGEVDFDAK